MANDKMVTIACKLPSGLIMELVEAPTDQRLAQISALVASMVGKKEQAERDAINAQIMLLLAGPVQGGRQLLPNPAGDRYTLKGSNSLLIHTGTPIGPAAQGVHRYATTRVPEAFAHEWFKRNAGLDCVKRELVFIVEDPKNPAPEIKERETDSQTRTGLEALAPEGRDPRMPVPKGNQRNAVTQDVDSMAQMERSAA